LHNWADLFLSKWPGANHFLPTSIPLALLNLLCDPQPDSTSPHWPQLFKSCGENRPSILPNFNYVLLLDTSQSVPDAQSRYYVALCRLLVVPWIETLNDALKDKLHEQNVDHSDESARQSTLARTMVSVAAAAHTTPYN